MKNCFFSASPGFRSGFTLVEVLVATVILSGVFFVLLKLVANNTDQTARLRQSRTMDGLFLSSKACLQSFGYDALAGTTGTEGLNFGNDNLGCFTGVYRADLSFPGIALGWDNATETGSTVFWSYFSVQNRDGGLKVHNTIESGTEKKEYNFRIGQ